MTAFKALGDVLLGSLGVIDGRMTAAGIFLVPIWVLGILVLVQHLRFA